MTCRSVRHRSYFCRRSCYGLEPLKRCRSSGCQHADLQTLPRACSVEPGTGTDRAAPA